MICARKHAAGLDEHESVIILAASSERITIQSYDRDRVVGDLFLWDSSFQYWEPNYATG